MDVKRELCRTEDEGWEEFHGLLESLTPQQMEAPGYYGEGWSVKDLMTHVCCWAAAATQMLEQIANGTYRSQPIDVDGCNRRFYEENRELPLPIVRAELWAARTRMLTTWNQLPQVTPAAEEWFRESGAEHYEEHLPRLREWAEALRSGSVR